MTDHRDQADRRVGLDPIHAALLGDAHGLEQQLLGAFGVGGIDAREAGLEQRLGNERLVAEPAGLGERDRCEHALVRESTRAAERGDLGEPVGQRRGDRARLGCGRRRHRSGQRVGVGAGVERGEPLDRGDRALDQRWIGGDEQVDQRAELAEPAIEARDAQIEQRPGLLAALRGHTRVVAHRDPVTGIAIERRGGLVKRRGLERLRGRRERRLHRGPPRLVPHPRESRRADLARRLSAAQHDHGERRGRKGDHRAADRQPAAGTEPTLERVRDRGHVGEAVRRHVAERAADDRAQPAGCGAPEPQLACRSRTLEHLEQRHRERVLIGAGVDHAPRQRDTRDALLGRHVRRRAADREVERRTLDREPEVDHARAAVVADHEVVGLDVAMDEAGPVRGIEAARRGGEHAHDVAPRSPGHPVAHRLAGHELHRQEHTAIPGADVVHRDDVGMSKPGERAALAQRAFVTGGIAVPHDLERDDAIEVRIVRLEHVAHRTARADLAHDVAADRATDRGAVGRLGRRAAPGAHRGGHRLPARIAALEVGVERREVDDRAAAADVGRDLVHREACARHGVRIIASIETSSWLSIRRSTLSTSLSEIASCAMSWLRVVSNRVSRIAAIQRATVARCTR